MHLTRRAWLWNRYSRTFWASRTAAKVLNLTTARFLCASEWWRSRLKASLWSHSFIVSLKRVKITFLCQTSWLRHNAFSRPSSKKRIRWRREWPSNAPCEGTQPSTMSRHTLADQSVTLKSQTLGQFWRAKISWTMVLSRGHISTRP